MRGTLCLDIICISIKYHEDILKIDYGRTDGLTEGQRHAIIRLVFQNGRIKSCPMLDRILDI